MTSSLWAGLPETGQADAVYRRVEELGYTPAAYLDCLRLSYRDFAIVCHQRSGSHFLASAIDSHPEICCQGELLQLLFAPQKIYAPVFRASDAKINGAVIMYNQWKVADALQLVPRHVIHLRRDSEKTALSILRNEIHASLHGSLHVPHEPRRSAQGKPRDYPVEKSLLNEWTASIRNEQTKFAEYFTVSKSCLDLTYEELCADRDVEQIDPAVAIRILKFLEVSSAAPLITTLRKTSS